MPYPPYILSITQFVVELHDFTAKFVVRFFEKVVQFADEQ